MSRIGTLAHEFPEYPAESIPFVFRTNEFTPEHWHNNTCPSYRHVYTLATVWVDFPDADDRESGSPFRYIVVRAAVDADSPREVCGDVWEDAKETDDANEALAFARTMLPEHQR